MPELPEVETIVRELRLTAIGKVFEFVELKNLSSMKSDKKKIAELKGRKLLGISRRGKFIVMEVSGGDKLIVHLRMTGRLLWQVEDHKKKYIRVVFGFSDGSNLYFSDVRKFGCVWYYGQADYEKATGIGKLGLEPTIMNREDFNNLIMSSGGMLKGFLLRQDIMSGIGNIYADEICFRSLLHPTRRVESLKRLERERLFESIGVCLADGIKNCGVSMSDFTGTRGNLGKHQKYLQVYGRVGDSCYQCGEVIMKMRTAGRGTFYCPNCQS